MRPIDADELKRQDFQDFSNTDVWYAIDNCPTIDAVPVVRCKDCHHADMIGSTLYCFHWSRNADEDGYCHEGY